MRRSTLDFCLGGQQREPLHSFALKPTLTLLPRQRNWYFCCRTTSTSTAPCTSRRMSCPTHCASYCAPCQLLLRALAAPPVWVVRVREDDGELRPWHFTYVYRIESRLILRVRSNGHPNPAAPEFVSKELCSKSFLTSQFTHKPFDLTYNKEY